jgi:hypothetical protein
VADYVVDTNVWVMIDKPIDDEIDATDTHWTKDRQILSEAGLTIQEICPQYIEEKLAR